MLAHNTLEERRVFTCGLLEGWKDELGSQLADFKAMVDGAVQLGQQLPVIGDQLTSVQNILDNFDTALPDAIEQGALDLGEEAIRQALFQVLHGGPLDLLGDTDEPSVAFKNVTIDFGGFLSSMLSPMVDFIKETTEPIKPVVDVVTAPIPVLSDLAHMVGLGDVSILSLAEVADDYMESTGYKEIIEIAEIVRQVVLDRRDDGAARRHGRRAVRLGHGIGDSASE